MSDLLTVEALTIAYAQARAHGVPAPVVDGVSFSLHAGRTLGLVGESGSGKSQIALAIMGLLPATAQVSGELRFEGQALTALPESQRRRLRGKRMGLIFQDPMTSLNPHLSVGLQLAEVLEQHEGATRTAALAEARRMLDAVRIPEAARRLRQYPHELSGGQRQRVMIAMMLLARPALLIADEPTTALDVTVQAAILRLLAELQRERGLALLMITHDLGVIADVAHEVVVLYAGQVMEQGPAAMVLSTPAHPYTRALLACRPRLDTPLGRLPTIAGNLPAVGQRATGCVFAPRCPQRQSLCDHQKPTARSDVGGRLAACHLV